MIASHSGVWELAKHSRNLNDEQLMAIGAAGGVVQIVGLNSFVKFYPDKGSEISIIRNAAALAAGDKEWDSSKHNSDPIYIAAMDIIDKKYPAATVKDFVDHIDYAVNLIGVEHVGIVSDFDGGGGIEGWNDASETMNVTAELISRGYSEEDIEKMKQEAEANADSDKAAKETAEKINAADGMIFQTDKQLKEFGEKLSDDKKGPIEAALVELKAAHESKDLTQIDAAMEKINEAWKVASEEMYKAEQEAGANPGADQGQPEAAAEGDNVEDVDFEEVK